MSKRQIAIFKEFWRYTDFDSLAIDKNIILSTSFKHDVKIGEASYIIQDSSKPEGWRWSAYDKLDELEKYDIITFEQFMLNDS